MEIRNMANTGLWLLLAIIWSSSYGAIKWGIETIGPMPLVAGRMIIGALIMLAILKYRRCKLASDVNSWLTYSVSGLMGSVLPFFLVSYGENNVDSGLAAILMGIAPVATVLVAPLVLHDEEFTTASILGIIVGVAGLVLLVGPGVLSGIGAHVMGQFSIVGATLCYAFTTIYVRRYATRSPLEMAAGSMLVGALSITLLTLVVEPVSTYLTPSAKSVSAMVYLGIFPTAVATLIYFYLIPRLGAIRMSQVNFAVPVGGALIGIFILGETITLTSLLGLLVIMFAIYLVTVKSIGR
jgi:drug/metabolite transporter (DMT)-like permease